MTFFSPCELDESIHIDCDGLADALDGLPLLRTRPSLASSGLKPLVEGIDGSGRRQRRAVQRRPIDRERVSTHAYTYADFRI